MQQRLERGKDMDIEQVKAYIRVDYEDDDALIQLLIDAVTDEMKELIPKFDPENPTNRQKVLICAYVKELYDERGNTTASKEKIRYAVQSLMLKEMLR